MQIDLPCNLGCLRQARAEDAAPLARYANNRRVWLNLRDGFPHPYSLDDAIRFIAMAGGQQPPAILIIEAAGGTREPAGGRRQAESARRDAEGGMSDGDGPEAIGAIGLRLQQDVERVSAEMGYWIGEPFWGRGITTAAVRAMVTYAFRAFPLTRVFAMPYASNAASARVLEKARFRLEARMRRAVLKDGVVQDQLLYAVTDEEWRGKG